MKAIFVYSQKDVQCFKQLRKYLFVNHRDMSIISHVHADISSPDFDKDIEKVDIFFLLISIESLSLSSWQQEVKSILKYKEAINKRKEICVLPIRIDNTSYTKSVCKNIQPVNEKPIEEWKPQKKAYNYISQEIEKAVDKTSKSIKQREVQELIQNQKNQREIEEFIRRQQTLLNERKSEIILTGIIVTIIFVGIALFSRRNLSDNVCSLDVGSEDYLHQGDLQEKDWDFEKAIDKYSCAIKVQPQSLEAYVKRGKIYFKQGNYKLAINDFRKVIEDNNLQQDDKLFFYYHIGESYRNLWETNQSEENKINAFENYNKAIKINNQYAYAFYGRGQMHENLGEREDAILNFNRALFLFNKNPKEKANAILVREKRNQLK